jgi:hypothetical protein
VRATTQEKFKIKVKMQGLALIGCAWHDLIEGIVL